jgi:predicted secreted protein
MDISDQSLHHQASIVVGQRLALVLDEFPSTGYLWTFRGAKDLLIIVEDFEPNSAAGPELIGAGGRRHLSVSGRRPGRYHLTFVNRQPWKGGRTAGQAAIDITVTEA